MTERRADENEDAKADAPKHAADRLVMVVSLVLTATCFVPFFIHEVGMFPVTFNRSFMAVLKVVASDLGFFKGLFALPFFIVLGGAPYLLGFEAYVWGRWGTTDRDIAKGLFGACTIWSVLTLRATISWHEDPGLDVLLAPLAVVLFLLLHVWYRNRMAALGEQLTSATFIRHSLLVVLSTLAILRYQMIHGVYYGIATDIGIACAVVLLIRLRSSDSRDVDLDELNAAKREVPAAPRTPSHGDR